MSWLWSNPAFAWPVGIAVGLALLNVLARVAERRKDAWPEERPDNGIRVGAPKVYDNRSLSLMLEQLEAQLKTVQSIDAAQMNAAAGTIQGERRTDWSAALEGTITTNSDMGTSQKETKKPDIDSAASSTKSDAVPPADADPFKFGARPLDLLNDQVNLSYEIFNLRLLLERALTDRLQNQDARLQAVIGVPISLDPPPYATDCAATVELKIKTRASLVALFPQQETFNTWGVDRRQFQFSGVFQGAGSGSGKGSLGRASQASFLRRHAEVVALERESGENELVVAWQFRPAPGARTIAAGLRQMLMVIALQEVDTGDTPVSIQVDVRSSWQKWSAHSETAARGPGWRAILSNRPTHHQWGSHQAFYVPRTKFVEDKLRPFIESIEWVRVGAEKAAVIVNGRNFFTGLSVVLGDKVVNAEPELIIKSERSLQILTPIEALMREAVLNGRYGASLRMIVTPPTGAQALRINGASIDPSPKGESYVLKLYMSARNGAALNWNTFRALPDPVCTINGELVPDLLAFDLDPNSNQGVVGSVRISSKFGPNRSALIIVRWPFYGEDWSLHYQTLDPSVQVSAIRFASTNGLGTLLLSGGPFSSRQTLILDQHYPITDSGPFTKLAEDLLKLELPAELMNQYRECFLCEPEAESIRVAIPDAPANPEPELDLSAKPPLLATNEDHVIELAGIGLDTVTQARLNGTVLSFVAYASGKSASVMIPGAALANPGRQAILLETRSGRALMAPILVRAAQNATES